MKKLLGSTKFQAGFTLIEVLIVVVIIVIIIGVLATSYTTVARNSRDSQRKSDMKKIQLALQQFHADHGAYPDEHGDAGPHGDSDYFTCSTRGDLAGDALIELFEGAAFTCSGNTYMSVIPSDPGTRAGYLYEIHENIKWDSLSRPGWCDNPTDPADPPAVNHGNCKYYTLWARLENPSDPEIFDPTDPAADSKCKIAYDIEDWIQDRHYNYCVHD